MNDTVCITFIVVVFAFVFASCGYHIGVGSGQDRMRKQAIENNAGYYCPQSGRFMWRENLEPVEIKEKGGE